MQYLKLKLARHKARGGTVLMGLSVFQKIILFIYFIHYFYLNFIYLFLINFYCSILDLQCCVFIYSFRKHVVQEQQIFRNRSVYN